MYKMENSGVSSRSYTGIWKYRHLLDSINFRVTCEAYSCLSTPEMLFLCKFQPDPSQKNLDLKKFKVL